MNTVYYINGNLTGTLILPPFLPTTFSDKATYQNVVFPQIQRISKGCRCLTHFEPPKFQRTVGCLNILISSIMMFSVLLHSGKHTQSY